MAKEDLLNPTPLDPEDNLPSKEVNLDIPISINPPKGRKFHTRTGGIRRDIDTFPGYDPAKYSEYIGDVFKPTGGTEALREMQSRLQPWDDLAVRGLGRFASKALTEVAKIPGYAAGGVGAIATGDIKTMVDNSWINFIEDIDESAKENLPVYASPLLEKGSLCDTITSGSFWATDFADGLGFLVSMFTPGIALKAMGTGAKIARGVNTAKLMKLGKPASLVDKVSKGAPLGTADLKLLGKAGLVGADKIDEITGVAANTILEAAAESAGTVDNLKMQFAQKVKNGEMTQEEADRKIEEAGTSVFLNNIALLIGPNVLSYKAVMGNFAPFRSMANRLKTSTGQLVKEAPKLSGKSRLGRFLGAVGAGIVSEGAIEEGGQFAIEDYYNDKALGETDKDYFEGIVDSYKEAWDTLEGQKAMFIGALLGGGMGSIQTLREDAAFKKNANNVFKMLQKTNSDFAANLTNLYKTELFTDEEGEQKLRYILDEDTKQPVIDPLKVEQYFKNVADGTLTDLYMQVAAMADNKDLYDTAFNDMMTRLVVPYASIEGGMELLEGQLEAISESMAKSMAETEGINISERSSEIKSELMEKAEKIAKDVNFMDIYDNTYFDIKIPNKGYAKQRDEFIEKIKKAVTYKSAEQRFHQDKMDEHTAENETIESQESVTELDKQKIDQNNKLIGEHEKIRDQRIQEVKDLLNKKLQQQAFAAEVQLQEAKKAEAEKQNPDKKEQSARLSGYLKELWDKNTFAEEVKFEDLEGTVLHSSELNIGLPEDVNLEDYLADTSLKDAGVKMPPNFTMTKVTRTGNIELTSTNPEITQKAFLNQDGSFVFGTADNQYRIDSPQINVVREAKEMRKELKVEARLKSLYSEGERTENKDGTFTVKRGTKGVIQSLRDQIERIEKGIGRKFEEIDILMKAAERALANKSGRAYINVQGTKIALTVKAIEDRILEIREGEKTIDPATGEIIIVTEGIDQLSAKRSVKEEEMEVSKQEYRKLKKGFRAKDPSVTVDFAVTSEKLLEEITQEIEEWSEIIKATEAKIKTVEGALGKLKALLKGAYTLYKKALETFFPTGVPILNIESIDEIAANEGLREQVDAILGASMEGRKRGIEKIEDKIQVKEAQLEELNKKLLEYKSKLNRVNPATGVLIEGSLEKALRHKKAALKRFYQEYLNLAKGVIEQPKIDPEDVILGKEDASSPESSYDKAMEKAEEEFYNPEIPVNKSALPPFYDWKSFFRTASNQELADPDSPNYDPNVGAWFKWLEEYDPASGTRSTMIYSYDILDPKLEDYVTFFVRGFRGEGAQLTKSQIKELTGEERIEALNAIREEKELKVVVVNKKSKDPVFEVGEEGDTRAVFTSLHSGVVETLYTKESGYERFSYEKYKETERNRIKKNIENYDKLDEEEKAVVDNDIEKKVESRLAKRKKEEGILWLEWRQQFFPEESGRTVKPLEMGIAYKNPGAKQIDAEVPWGPVETRIVETQEDLEKLQSEGNVFVATKTSETIGGRVYPLKKGAFYVINQGRVEYLKPKTLEESGETERVLDLLRYYARLDRTSEDSSTKQLVEMLRENLGSVMYFNYPKSDKKPQDFPYKIYMTPSTLYFGANKISVSELVNNREGAKVEELREFLNSKYHHAEVRALGKNKSKYSVFEVVDPNDLSKGLNEREYTKKEGGYLGYLLAEEDDGTSAGTAKFTTNVPPLGDPSMPQYLNSSLELSENVEVKSARVTSPEYKKNEKTKAASIAKNTKYKGRGRGRRGTGRRGTGSRKNRVIVERGDTKLTIEGEGEISSDAISSATDIFVPSSMDDAVESGFASTVAVSQNYHKNPLREELRLATENTEEYYDIFLTNIMRTGKYTEEEAKKAWDRKWSLEERMGNQKKRQVDESKEKAIKLMMEMGGLSRKEAEEKYENNKDEEDDVEDRDRLADLNRLEKVMNSKEIEWFRQKYPEVPIINIAGLIGGRSYGRLTTSLQVLLSDIATEGTLFHEAFHIVTQIFMDPAEREAMYQEVRERLKGQKVRTYNEEGTEYIEVEGENLTDDQAEEFLAEEFRSFMLAEGNYTFPESAKEEKSLFQTIWNFIKDFFNTLRGKKNEAPYTLEQIFKDIADTPSYELSNRKGELIKELDRIPREKIVTTNSKGESVVSEQEPFNETYSLTLIKDFNYKFFDQLLNNKGENASTQLLDFNESTLKNIWINTLLSYMKELDTLNKRKEPKDLGRKQLVSDIVDNFRNIREEHINFLKQYGVGIQGDLLEDLREDPETAAERETRDNRGWTESNTTSAKAIMPPAIKLIIAGLSLKEELTSDSLEEEIALLEQKLKRAKSPKNVQKEIELLQKKLEEVKGKVIDTETGKETYYSLYIEKLKKAKTKEERARIEKRYDVVTPKRKFKEKKIGKYLANATVRYGNTINKLQNELIGLNEEEVIAKILEMSYKNPEFSALIDWLKLNVPQRNLSKDDIILQTQFFNHFNMNKNNPYITLVTRDGSLILKDAVNSSSSTKLLDEWRNNIKAQDLKNTLFKKGYYGGIIIDKNKKITLSRQSGTIEELDTAKITPEDQYSLLLAMGLDIPVAFSELTDVGKLNGVDWIITTIQEKLGKGEKVSIDDIFTKEGLDVTGRIGEMVEYLSSLSGEIVDLQYVNQEGKTEYSVTLNSSLSNIIHRLNRIARKVKELKGKPDSQLLIDQYLESVEDILLPFSENNPNGNLYSTNSDWISKIKEGKEIQLVLLRGMKEMTDTGIDTSNLTHADFVAMSFNTTMKGMFPFLRAADRKLEYAFKIEGEEVDYSADLGDFLYDFKKYLIDELLTVGGLVKFGIGENVKNYRENGQDLRFFKSILPDGFIEDFKSRITTEEIQDLNDLQKITEKFVRNKERLIERRLSIYFNDSKTRIKEKLLNNRVIDNLGDVYRSNGIDTDIISNLGLDPKEITEEQLNIITDIFSYASLKANIEQTKIFTGDPAMFASIEAFHKRTTGAASTRQSSRNGGSFEIALNKEYTRADGKIYDGNARKIVYTDADAIPEEYPGEIATEGDAQGRTTLDGHREILLRQGTWREEEKTYQYEMQSFFLNMWRNKRNFNRNLVTKEMFINMFGEHTNGKMPSSPMYKGEIIDNLGDLPALPPIKPQGFGHITGLSNLQATDFTKLSLAPIMLSTLKSGDPMFERVLNMMENQIDIGVFISGEKAAAYVNNKGELQDYYDENGSPAPINENLIQSQSFQDFGIQLEIDPKGKEKTKKATQQERLLFVDLFNVGKIDLKSKDSKSKIENLREERKGLTNEYVKRERERLISKLGLEETKTGKFKLVNNDPTKFRELLLEELTRRQMPYNIMEGMNLATTSENKLMDTLITKDNIESILMGLVRNKVISTKVNGYQAVQEASTGHEKGDRVWTTIKKKDGTTQKVLTNNYLKSYTKNEDGTISPMEVEIPLPKEWNTWVSTLKYETGETTYKGLEALNKMIEEGDPRIDKKLLLITGNRIPADGLHSLDAMKVKNFLPTHFGQKIVLPTGIVIKAGSDFDIDKLSIYLPNAKMTNKGPKYVKYQTDPLTKERVEEVYDRRYGALNRRFEKLEELRANAEIVAGQDNAEVTKLLSAIFETDLDILEEEVLETTIELFKSKLNLIGYRYQDYEDLKEKIGKIPTKAEFVEKYEGKNPVVLNTKKSIENRMIEIALDTILISENYDQLLNPVAAETLKRLSSEVRTENKELKYSDLMEWSFNMEVARNNWEGIRGRAMAAIATASHSLTQIVPITIEDNHFEIYLEGQERKNGKYLMGHVKDMDGQIISNNLGEFLTAYVDVAADPFIRFLNMGQNVFPVYNMLQRFSNSTPASLETLMYFFTQPIIQDLIHQREINSSIFLKASGRNRSFNDIIEDLAFSYGGNTENFESTHYKDMREGETELEKSTAEKLVTKAKYLNSLPGRYSHLSKNKLKKVKDGIEKGNRLPEYLKVQLQVLDNFLFYEEASKSLKSFQQIARPDAALGARRSSLKIREDKIEKLKEEKFLSPKDIENHLNLTYLREYNRTQEEVIPIYSEFFFTDKYGDILINRKGDTLGDFLTKMMSPYLSKKANMSERDLYKVAQNIENALITFILHTQTSSIWKKDSKDIPRSLNEFYEDLLLTTKSPAKNIKKIDKEVRKKEKTPKGEESNMLFSKLIPLIEEYVGRRGRKRSLNNIKLLNLKYTTEELNSMTTNFLELFESGNPKMEEFAKDLMKLQLVQSGVSPSVISFGKIVPEEYFQPTSKVVIDQWIDSHIKKRSYGVEDFLENFKTNFYRGSWNNPVVVPRKNAKKVMSNRITLYTGEQIDKYDPNKTRIHIYRKDKDAGMDYLSVEGYSVSYQRVRELQKEAREAGRPYATIPTEIYLFKKVYNVDGTPLLSNNRRSYVYDRVSKLGDGMYFTEFYNNSDPSSILSYNKVSFVKSPKKKKKVPTPKDLKKAETERDKDPPIELDKIKQQKKTKSITKTRVIEGDIFNLKGIPVVTTNLGGVHGAGLAQIAASKGLIKRGDGDFKATNNVVQLPVKKHWRDSMKDNDNINLLKSGLESLVNTARSNPSKTYLLPLAGLGHGEGSVSEILPLLIKTIKSSPNIKLVLPGTGVNLGRQGTVRKDYTRKNIPKIKEMLTEAGLLGGPSTKGDIKRDMPSLFGSEVSQSPAGQAVEERMRTFLKAIGVDIKEVSRIYDRRGKVLNAHGLAKLSKKVVQITKGEKGLNQLPEEAAHFFVAMLPKESSLKKAMFDNITNYDIYQDTVEKYGDYYGGDIDAIKEEAVGKLIAKKIIDIQNGNIDNEGFSSTLSSRQQSQLNTWFGQLLRLIKNWFSKIKTDPYVKSAYKMLQADVSNLVPEVSKEVAEEEMPSLEADKTFEKEKKEASEKYLKKDPYWFDGKQYSEDKIFSNATAERIANTISQNYPSIEAKIVNIEEGKARINLYPSRKNVPGIEEIELKEAENNNKRRNNTITNVKQISGVSSSPVSSSSEAMNELMVNFEEYFPQFAHYSKEEREAIIEYMASGHIEIKCKR